MIRDLEGSYALGIIFADHPDQVYAVRCESPLIVGVGKGESFIASDVPAIIEYTRDYYLLEHEEIAVLGSDGVHIYDAFGQPVEKELKTADWDVEAIGKNGYAHFMLKEIHEQPTAIRNTILPRIQDGLPNLEECGITPEMLRSFRHIQVVACGTAMHAGTVGKYVIEKLARVPVTVDIASEFRYRDPLVPENTLVVIISQSGETADSLAALRKAKEQGAKTLAIVNVVGSTIAREADYVFYTLAGPEIAVATTKAYSAQLLAVYALAIAFAQDRGQLTDDQAAALVRELESLPGKMERLLEDEERIQWFASKQIAAKDIFFIGRGLDYAISLIEPGTLVVGVLTQQKLYEKTLSNLLECKTRGAYLMALTTYGNYSMEDNADFVLYIPKTDPHFAPSLAVIPLQLLGYYVSVAKGLDVDKPRNLAKSVTVE